MTSKTEIHWAKCLLVMFALAVYFIPAIGQAETNAAPANTVIIFEKPQPKVGSIPWETSQRLYKAQQEKYRKIVPLPDVFGSNIPRAEITGPANGSLTKAARMQSPALANTPGIYQRTLFWVVVFCAAGIWLLRTFAPEVLTNVSLRLNPWSPMRTAKTARAEDEAFDDFLTNFRSDSATQSRTVTAEAKVREFYEQAADLLTRQRMLLQEIVRETDMLSRKKLLARLRVEMEILKNLASFPEALCILQLASCLEGLLGQLAEKVGNATPSTLRTVASGVELLEDFLSAKLNPDLIATSPLTFLVVDDDWISRQALMVSLGKAFGQQDLVADGKKALAQLEAKVYDVIFLDVQMPKMDGYELCTKIRETPLNAKTPVVFVSVHGDFNARARATLSGGNELMAKPFLTFEITVKALTLALANRLQATEEIKQKLSLQNRDLLDPLLRTFATSEAPMAKAEVPTMPHSELLGLEEMTAIFLSRVKNHTTPLQQVGRQLLQSKDDAARHALLVDGFLRVNSLVSKNDARLQHPSYQLVVALEALFRKLLMSVEMSSASAPATIASAADLLHDLCLSDLKADRLSLPIETLVVDDDLVARRVITGALQTMLPRPENVENGEQAVALAAEKSFDVIFLDVVMPGLDGYETCMKIRESVLNHDTPVIFISGQFADKAREKMVGSGGSDMMDKPFLIPEITVKAFTFALRSRLKLTALNERK
jgi:CheY-like chemotaxis protein